MNYHKYTSSKKASPENSANHHYKSEDIDPNDPNNPNKIMNLMKRRTSEEKASNKLGRSSD